MRKIFLILPICCLAILAFGQRDTIIVYKKGEFKVTERHTFYPNKIPKSVTYQSSGERLFSEYSKEDLFARGIDYNRKDALMINGIKTDSIIYFRHDGRVDRIEYFKKNFYSESHLFAHHVYNRDKSLMQIDTQYTELGYKSILVKDKIVLKSNTNKFIFERIILPTSKIGETLEIPLHIQSELDEAVIITINKYRVYKDLRVSNPYFHLEANQLGTLFLKLDVNNTFNINRLIIEVQSNKETYNIELEYKVKGFHFTEKELKENVYLDHFDNQTLALLFENKHEKIINIYKEKALILNKNASKDYAIIYINKLEKGDYFLEVIDIISNENTKLILRLK